MIEMARKIALTMLEKSWLLYRAPKDSFFVTSDTPVVFGLPGHVSAFGMGPAHPYAELTIPLSKGLTLVICPSSKPQESFKVCTATNEKCLKINACIARAANHFIFTPKKVDWLKSLAKVTAGMRQAITVGNGIEKSFSVVENPYQRKK
jgi:hypothetical protein